MLTPKVQLNLAHARAYFREHLAVGDYYAEHERVAGQWCGEAAARLGLSGVVAERDFLRLCAGLHPRSGTRLTARQNSTRRENGRQVANRRVFYDFTFSPPKSVSVVALLCDERIVALHEAAVRAALSELERYTETRVRKGGQDGERVTANLVAATFRHETSRAKDPHLHTHAVVLNATFDPAEERWKALQAGGLYRVQKLVEAVYYHELKQGLLRLGYALERTPRDFAIRGVPASVVHRFSQRRQQIDAATEALRARGELRGNVYAVRARLARTSRPRKGASDHAERLRTAWNETLTPSERQALVNLRGTPVPPAPADVDALVTWAEDHVFERQAVTDESVLLTAALRRAHGQAVALEDLRRALAQRAYVRDPLGRTLTTPAILRGELDLVFAAQDGRGRHGALAPAYRPPPELSPEQDQAVTQILTSRDFLILFRGGAGTGKSFALQAVHAGLQAAQRPLRVCAPQRQQVEDLVRDGLPAQTLARLLTEPTLPPGVVVLVDEAGQIGGRELRTLVQRVQAQRGRVILSGDTRQYGAVAATDALRALEAYGGLRPAEITTLRRQDPRRGPTPTARREIARYRAAVQAAAAGDPATAFARLDRLGWIHEVSDPHRYARLATEYLAAQARRESTVVVAQTWTEARAVNAAIRTALRSAGEIPAGVPLTCLQAMDTTQAERRDPAQYAPGLHVCFVRGYGRFAAGATAEVIGAGPTGVRLRYAGICTTVKLRYADRFTLAQAVPLEVAPGDRLQLKFNGRSREGWPCTNGELVTVAAVAPDGAVAVQDASGRRKTLLPHQRLFNRGYALTTYAAQGKTVDTVLIADAGSTAATHDQQWYVAISRARRRALIFTADKAALRVAVQRTGDRPLALDVKPAAPGWTERFRQTLALLQRRAFVQRRRQVQTHAVKPTYRL
jgi:conjugative relaxase-like TrwC/TraI family protein